MPRPFFHERGIACGTTCDKLPMAKMDTVKVIIKISHLYKFFFLKNGTQAETQPYFITLGLHKFECLHMKSIYCLEFIINAKG